MAGIFVNGIVSGKTKEPMIQLSNENGMIAQLDAQDAIKFGMDLIRMAEMTKADALIVKWTEEFFPADKATVAGAQLMHAFREYRQKLEEESAQRQSGNPDA